MYGTTKGKQPTGQSEGTARVKSGRQAETQAKQGMAQQGLNVHGEVVWHSSRELVHRATTGTDRVDNPWDSIWKEVQWTEVQHGSSEGCVSWPQHPDYTDSSCWQSREESRVPVSRKPHRPYGPLRFDISLPMGNYLSQQFYASSNLLVVRHAAISSFVSIMGVNSEKSDPLLPA